MIELQLLHLSSETTKKLNYPIQMWRLMPNQSHKRDNYLPSTIYYPQKNPFLLRNNNLLLIIIITYYYYYESLNTRERRVRYDEFCIDIYVCTYVLVACIMADNSLIVYPILSYPSISISNSTRYLYTLYLYSLLSYFEQ